MAFSYAMHEFAKPMSSTGLRVEELVMPEESLGLYLDMGPYVNPTCYVVQEDASLSKVYTLFRTLGLRHLFVIPR
jgi:chloride channel 7